MLRLLEHRLQLRRLRRTHLMPTRPERAAAAGAAQRARADAGELRRAQWDGVHARVRGLHERLFYRPLLSAVARLARGASARSRREAAEADSRRSGSATRAARSRHIAALTAGVAARAAIQRTCCR